MDFWNEIAKDNDFEEILAQAIQGGALKISVV